MKKQINLSFIELETIDGQQCVTFFAEVDGVHVNNMMEWVNVFKNDEGNFLKLEVTDSHLRTNHADDLAVLGIELQDLRDAVNAELLEMA